MGRFAHRLQRGIPGNGSAASYFDPALVAGSALPGQTAYAIPSSGTVRYVDPTNGDDTTGTGLIGAPWKTAAKAGASVGTGGTIILRGYNATTNPTCSGIYFEGAAPGLDPSAVPAVNGVNFNNASVTIQAYPNEAVWFDGSKVVTGWVQDTTSVPGRTIWKRTAWPIAGFDRSPTSVRGAGDTNTSEGGSWIYIDEVNFPIAHWGEQVFIDGVMLTQVATLAEVTTGTFYLEGSNTGGTGTDKNFFTATTCYIGSSPVGKEVRASELATCMILGGDNVVLRGVGIRRYQPPLYCNAALKLNRAGCMAENVYIRDIASTGLTASLRANQVVRNVTVLNAGFRGMHSHNADNVLFDQVRIENADFRRFNPAPECGGIKITTCNKATVQGSVVSNNWCHGLWTDISVGDFEVLSNNIQNNLGHGVIAELSEDVIIANNLVTGAGKIGVYFIGTNGGRVWNNTIVDCGETALDVNDDSRTFTSPGYSADTRPSAYSPMTWQCTSFESYNNVVGNDQGVGIFRVRTSEDTPRSWQQMGAAANGNLYFRPGASPTNAFLLARIGSTSPNAYTTFAAYRTAAAALDAASQFVQGSTPVNGSYQLSAGALAAAANVPLALPADVGLLVNQPTGAKHLGAWR